MESTNKEFKLVFNAGVARALLKRNIPVADIKPDRNNRDKSIFAFKITPEFEEAFTQINNEIKESKKEAAVL